MFVFEILNSAFKRALFLLQALNVLLQTQELSLEVLDPCGIKRLFQLGKFFALRIEFLINGGEFARRLGRLILDLRNFPASGFKHVLLCQYEPFPLFKTGNFGDQAITLLDLLIDDAQLISQIDELSLLLVHQLPKVVETCRRGKAVFPNLKYDRQPAHDKAQRCQGKCRRQNKSRGFHG